MAKKKRRIRKAVIESERMERKSQFGGSVVDWLKLVKTITAMANTKGGRILISRLGRGVTKDDLDSAKIDDKVNKYVEPRISGIATRTDRSQIAITVESSLLKPHIFKSDGNYQNPNPPPQQNTEFYRGTIIVRHGSKNELINRDDMDRMFEERRQRDFERVKMVYEFPLESELRLVEKETEESLPVRLAPDDPKAQPVKELLTTDPFYSLGQELIAGVKAWKTSKQILNEIQILRAYKLRKKIKKQQIIELLFISSLRQRYPVFFWASKLPKKKLIELIKEIIMSDEYPAVYEIIRLVALLHKKTALRFSDLLKNTKYLSLKKVLTKYRRVVFIPSKQKRIQALGKLIYSAKRIVCRFDSRKIIISTPLKISEKELNLITDALLAKEKEKTNLKIAFKLADLHFYGAKI